MRTSTTSKKRLRARGYPHNLIEKITSEVKFTERKSALQENNEVRKKILPFVTTYHLALQNLKNILMSKWHLRWPDWIFGGGYLPSLSINYVAMSKDMGKRLPQLYYIKMKICYDLGFIAIGVAMAT